MDFKLKISCNKCHCSFELRPDYFERSEISCPNCSSKVSDEYATHIINGIREFSIVPSSYSDDESANSLISNSGFSFEIQNYSLFS
jgi:hypothetical protein